MNVHSLPKPDLDTAVEFLRALRDEGPWNVSAIAPDGRVTSATFTDPKKLQAWLAKRVASANLYYQSNPASKPTGKSGRAQKADIDLIAFLHVDIDLDKLSDARSLDDRKADALAGLVALDEPSFVVDSGGGHQAIWRLREPLPATPENIAMAEAAGRWLIQQFGGDSGTHNVDRLLRLPGTINYPNETKEARGRVVAPTRLVHRVDAAYSLDDFGRVEAAPMVEVDTEFGPPEEVLDIDVLIAEYSLPERLGTIIVAGRDEERPKPGDDSDSAWLLDATMNMLRAGVPPEVVMGVLLNSEWGISRSVYDPEKNGGRTPEAYALRQVKRALGFLEAERRADAGAFDEYVTDVNGDDSTTAEEPGDKRQHPFRRYSISELIDLPDPVWTVEGLILERSLAMLYGPPKSYKTFISLDLALCIATGKPFHGHATVQGRVTYVAAEGHPGETRDRVLAWCRENGVEPSSLDSCFALVIHGVKVDDPKTIEEFIRLDPEPSDLVVFDTLNRNMDGHESDTKDMTRFVAGCDKVRRVLKTAVIVVHHTGVDQGRERGSTVLRGAVDTRLKVSYQSGVSALLVEDQRAGPDGLKMHFRPVTIPLGQELGERDSLVMRSADAPRASANVELIVLLRIHDRRPEKWADLADDAIKGMSRANVYKVRDRLVDDGYVKDMEVPTLTKAGERLVGETKEDEDLMADLARD